MSCRVRSGSVSTGDFAPAVRAFDDADGAGRDQGGHAVCGGGCVAEIAAEAGAALHLRRADQVGGLDHAGPCLAQGFMLAERGARCGGADDESRHASSRIADDAGNALDIDDEVWALRGRRASAPGDRCRLPAAARRLVSARRRLQPRWLGRGIRHRSKRRSCICQLRARTPNYGRVTAQRNGRENFLPRTM